MSELAEPLTEQQRSADAILTPESLLAEEQRRREWVTLTSGRVCVWEFSVPEVLQVAERSQRPSIDPRGGVDPTESALWQITLACYDGDGDGARRIFSEHDPKHIRAIQRLGARDFKRLMRAIAIVNGTSEVEVKALEDFTGAPTAATP